MQKRRNSFIVLLIMTCHLCQAQKQELIANYITTYKDIAIAEMKRTGVPASITLAQGIHESGAGAGKLVLASNNHFGIKCKSNWTGEFVRHDDDAKGECFRKYTLAEESYKDHSDFLKNGQRYAFLFSLDPTDYAGWANGLKQAGYATNPKYPQVLIKLIEDYNLQEYTMTALGRKPGGEGIVVAEKPSMAETIPITAGETELKQVVVYPAGEFKINDTQVVFVKKGLSFLGIAKQYDIDLSKIFEFNEKARVDFADKDQLIYLQRKRKTGAHEFHIVQPGETIYSIAQQEGIRMENLRELNWLKENDEPAIGETLNMRSKSTSIPKLTVKDNYSLHPATGKKGIH